jgi:NADH:ubiquinone oxidoreductase subunit C
MPDPPTHEDAREEMHEHGLAPAPPDDEVAAALLERFDGAVSVVSHGQPVVHLDRSRWREAASFLRDEQQFVMAVDLTAVDHLTAVDRAVPAGVAPERFEVVANLHSHARHRRVRLVCQVPEADPQVASLTPVYAGLDFAEREVYDMFGIAFTDHPDLTRILMPDDWSGFPLRKDDAPARVPVTFKEDPRPS